MAIRPGLTCVGYGWSLLSIIAAGAISAGYYNPLWLIGSISHKQETIDAYFGCFRRCNYPKLDPNDQQTKLAKQCGRYKSFTDIPTLWWQICTVTVGVGCAAALLVAFVTVPAWCAKDIISRTSARVLGIVQAMAAVLVAGGCVIYPLGWGHKEVTDACGDEAGPYLLGNCYIGWAYYLVVGGALLLLVCSSLSTMAGKPVEWQKLRTSGTDERSALKIANI